MKEELQTIKERKVWNLIPKPENAKVLGCRWVYTLKRNEKGKPKSFKARLVAQGFRQIKGESYDEVFSPVVNFAIIRFFFSLLVSLNKWEHQQCDVKCAYLYAPIDKEIYMHQPPGFEIGKNLVCKLQKALYGLHQSGRNWFFEIHGILGKLGFKKFEWCNCAYRYKKNVILLLYVDDMIIFGKDQNDIDTVISLLKCHFELKLLGRTRKLLGVEFEEHDGNVFIHQHDYIKKICLIFNEYRYPISSLPIAKGIIYSKTKGPQTENEKNEMQRIPYRSLIGHLAFLAGRTRPDITYAVNLFSQYQEEPGMTHWNGLLKLLGYLDYTKDMKLCLSNIRSLDLHGYSDADFANNRDDRTSMGGHIILLDKVPITWRTFKQKVVALSSMESEFIALTEASKELTWFHRILSECVNIKIIPQNYPIPRLYVDNQACIEFVKSPIESHRTKHIDVKLFFVRDLVYKKIFTVHYIQSNRNLADVFTKGQTKTDLNKFKHQILVS